MATKFLDKTGLSHFWSKIKAWCNAVFAPIVHNQASNTINAMTGYSKPSSGSAIATSDSLNSAIGKLEAKVDAYDDSNYVHKTGTESISGSKTFTSSIKISDGNINILRLNTSKGTLPSANKYVGLYFGDQTNADPTHRYGDLETAFYSSGLVSTYIRAFKNTADSTANCSISCNVDSNGNSYTSAPTPSITDSSTKIATTAFVKNVLAAQKRICIVGQSGESSTNPWYKVASSRAMVTNDDVDITFLVEHCYNNKAFGILKVHARTDNTGTIDQNNCTINWLVQRGFNLSHFVLVLPTTANPVVELWTCINLAWLYRKFTVLSEGNRSEERITDWTLHNASSTGQSASITTQGNQKVSQITGNVSYADTSYLASLLRPSAIASGSPINILEVKQSNNSDYGVVNTRVGASATENYYEMWLYNKANVASIGLGLYRANNDVLTARIHGGLTVLNKDSGHLTFRYNTVERNGSSVSCWNVAPLFIDKNGVNMGGLYHVYEKEIKRNTVQLIAYKGQDTTNTFTTLGVGYNASGNAYSWAPNLSIYGNVVYQNGDNQLRYYVVNSSIVKASTPTIPTDYYTQFAALDKNSNYLQCISLTTHPSKEVNISLNLYDPRYETNVNHSKVISFRANSSWNAFTFGPDEGGTNSINLGYSNALWKQVYAGTTAISTSDERLKTDITPISEDILAVWENINIVNFKFKDAVEEKGNKARIHSGFIAQDIDKKFIENKLDTSKYAFFCYDEWDAKEAIVDKENNIQEPAIEAGNRYSLRYEEALCIEAAYQRYKNKILENRISELEKRLAKLEGAV